ncbi:MAG: DUF4184 family protein [Pseudomonadota bacterium]
MPFTISHAAAVLPLHKWSKARLPLAALMIGSMSPDFAFFLPGEREQSHSIAGLFWYCWPLSIVAWLLFVRVLEQPTLALLPRAWSTRFAASDRDMTFRTLALASVAVILGAVTHLIWDSFTHRGTAVVEAIPMLNSVAFYFHGWRIRWFVVLQLLSSGLGAALLAFWAWRLAPGRHVRNALPVVSHATRISSVVFLVAVSSGSAITNYLLHPDSWFERRLFHFLIGAMSGWLVAWLAVAAAIGRHARSGTATSS